jgi:hypothetical protein
VIGYERAGAEIRIDTGVLTATVRTEGYVSGVAGGTLVDRRTGARDLGHGLDIADFLLEPGWADPAEEQAPGEAYSRDPAAHGHLPKHYVELPQICTKAGRLEHEVFEGEAAGGRFVAVRQWFRYLTATPDRQAGSLWEQTLVFLEGKRYFLAADRVASQNDSEALVLRIDMPGHIKHRGGDTFGQIYLSYATNGAGPGRPAKHSQTGQVEHDGRSQAGCILASSAFDEPFAPDARYLYQRGKQPLPERFIRAYQVILPDRPDEPGPWLAGMTLAPDEVYEAWCHEKAAGRYVCFIQEIGGRPVRRGGCFGAAYVVGYFDLIQDMEAAYDRYRGTVDIDAGPDGYCLLQA